MPTTVQLDKLPMGFAATSALPGESVAVRMKECVTSEDGNLLTQRLEGVSHCFASCFEPHTNVRPSQVDNFLAIIRPDKSATVYCNEVYLLATFRVKKPFSGCKAGDPIYAAQVAELERLRLLDRADKPIEIPSDCGYQLILSHDWRKLFCYDLMPLNPREKFVRADDLEQYFAGYMNRLYFQELFSATTEQWLRLFDWGWFPFIWMDEHDRRGLLNWAVGQRKPQPVLVQYCDRFMATLSERLKHWSQIDEFLPHMGFIETAARTYAAGDYVSSLSTAMPRIEGILHHLLCSESPNAVISQETMAANLIENRTAFSSLVPDRFKEYLMAWYFKGFQIGGSVPLSRHSIAHGVSSVTDCNYENASLAFMVLYASHRIAARFHPRLLRSPRLCVISIFARRIGGRFSSLGGEGASVYGCGGSLDDG